MTLYLVLGPPAAGKSTWVRQHAQHGDVTIDYDAIANVLTVADPAKPHEHTPIVKAVTKAARQAAIDTALKHHHDVDVYVIHSMPGATTLDRYRALGARIVTVDPGIDVVLARCKAERPWQMQQAVKEWYQQHPANNGQTPANDTAMPW